MIIREYNSSTISLVKNFDDSQLVMAVRILLASGALQYVAQTLMSAYVMQINFRISWDVGLADIRSRGLDGGRNAKSRVG
ncbi:hypothetical protein N7495_007772 [Penicillium taxi]|uniref:uncharacterized protein n=1 Tax=Penicillium taxi TaxID=168475 RepID=UPI002544E0EF|nr:uncharacterized protein N7495_007772 [Penicillium taxi]KAJ5887731.1 hypothetical protein N7495_007772 [Penicillium taxi]